MISAENLLVNILQRAKELAEKKIELFCTPALHVFLYNRYKKKDFVNNLKDLSETDLSSRIGEDEQRLKKLEFAHAISPLESPVNIRLLRKDIARLKTELTKRKIGTPALAKV